MNSFSALACDFIQFLVILAVASIAFLAIGTALFPDGAEDRADVESFFRQINAKA